MKIFVVIQCSNLGGMERSALETIVELQREGHEVSMFSMQPVGDLKEITDAHGIRLEGTSRYLWWGIGNLGALVKKLKSERPQLLLLVGHNFAAPIAAKILNINTFLSIHFHHENKSLLRWRIFYWLASVCCSGVRFVSWSIYDEVKKLLDGFQKKTVIYNIIREPDHIPDPVKARTDLGIPIDAFVIGNGGWLIKRKAFGVFLRCAKIISQKIPKAMFVIAGDGPEKEHLLALTKDLGLEEKVRYIGWQTDIADFYAAIDVLLFNSYADAIPRAPLEAMMYEKPVVASCSDAGLAEIIRNGIDGVLMREHDEMLLAEEVCRLYRDEQLLREYASNGKKRVESKMSAANHLQEMKCFLEID